MVTPVSSAYAGVEFGIKHEVEKTDESDVWDPKIRVITKVCFFGCAEIKETLSHWGQCAFTLFPWRICARLAGPKTSEPGSNSYGNHTASKPDTRYAHIPDDPRNTGEPLPRVQLCAYEDPVSPFAPDLVDWNWFLQPYHYKAKNPGMALAASAINTASNMMAVAAIGSAAASLLMFAIAPYGMMLAFLAIIGKILSLFIDEANLLVIGGYEGAIGCVEIPLAPYPPPFCQHIVPVPMTPTMTPTCTATHFNSIDNTPCAYSASVYSYTKPAGRISFFDDRDRCSGNKDPGPYDDCVSLHHIGTNTPYTVSPCGTTGTTPCVKSNEASSGGVYPVNLGLIDTATNEPLLASSASLAKPPVPCPANRICPSRTVCPASGKCVSNNAACTVGQFTCEQQCSPGASCVVPAPQYRWGVIGVNLAPFEDYQLSFNKGEMRPSPEPEFSLPDPNVASRSYKLYVSTGARGEGDNAISGRQICLFEKGTNKEFSCFSRGPMPRPEITAVSTRYYDPKVRIRFGSPVQEEIVGASCNRTEVKLHGHRFYVTVDPPSLPNVTDGSAQKDNPTPTSRDNLSGSYKKGSDKKMYYQGGLECSGGDYRRGGSRLCVSGYYDTSPSAMHTQMAGGTVPDSNICINIDPTPIENFPPGVTEYNEEDDANG